MIEGDVGLNRAVIKFVEGSRYDPKDGLGWCTECRFPLKMLHYVKTTDAYGYWTSDGRGANNNGELYHRGHILEQVPANDFANLTVPGWRGRIARATYQYVREKLVSEDLLRVIAKFDSPSIARYGFMATLMRREFQTNRSSGVDYLQRLVVKVIEE